MSENDSTQPIIHAKNINAGFGPTHVLKSINLEIGKNEMVALIGPSGCGKSTFIRCLNRMHEEVESAYVTGKVILEGKNIYGPMEDPVKIRRKVGMVFQKPNPFPLLSIYDNAAAGLKLAGVRKKALLNEAVERALRQSALWDEVKDRLKAPGTSLSGGQQQRLCIARTLAVNPPVVLMDEPTSALDPIATTKIEELIKELKKEMTIVIVTHNMQQAARISDKTAFFLLGEVVEFNKTSEIFTNPHKEQTESYITGRFG